MTGDRYNSNGVERGDMFFITIGKKYSGRIISKYAGVNRFIRSVRPGSISAL